ncbi:MAG: hypothetical protein JWP03_2329 [Phycisphaerales bacterium]|jgi:hypothetical protein|nr:hypothetical protein [Phycisphaerales bacterium]
MVPLDQADNINSFTVVDSLEKYPPGIRENIVARIITDQCVRYSPERLRITGTLHVRPLHDEEYLISVYDMTVDSVREVQAR